MVAFSRPASKASGLAGILAVLLAAAVTAADNPPPAAPDGPSPMDEPLRLIGAARESFRGVRDYSCQLTKRERLRGQLQPENVIAMKVRNQPFSVCLTWQEPRALVGQEACYVAGRNDGMMRVRTTGLTAVLGFISLDPRDPRALEHSRHNITEAGIGHLIDGYGTGWEEERRINRSEVRVEACEFGGRPCTRVETVHPPGDRRFTFYRSLVYFDKENHLPVRVENYDRPRPKGGADGELSEVYGYTDLRLNVGLRDEDFNR
jgi:Protein of unknown function (DUF1571)